MEELTQKEQDKVYGELIDLRKSKWNETEKYIEFIIGEKTHRAHVKKIGYKRTLEIKLDVWKKAGGDREAYDLLVRYALTKARVWKIDNNELQNNGEIDELLWDSLDEDVVDYMTNYLYGLASLENPHNEEFLKNLVGEFLKDETRLKGILNSVNLNVNKEPPLEAPLNQK